MIKYRFKEGPVLGFKNASIANPQKIGDALRVITDANGGILKPLFAVKAAQNKSNDLHQHFEWSDKAAAHAHRLDQARAMIRSIEIVIEPNEKPCRAWYSVAEPDGVAYRTGSDVLDSPKLQALVLEQAERDFAAYEHRLREFQDICDDIRRAREKIAAKRASMKGGDVRP